MAKTVSIGGKNYKEGSKAYKEAVSAGGTVASKSTLAPTYSAGNTRNGQPIPDRINIGGTSYSYDKVASNPELMKKAMTQQSPQGEVDTSQPSPQTAEVQPFTGDQMVPYEQAQQALATGGLTGGALASAQENLAQKYGKSKFQIAHETLQKQGPAPMDAGEARSQLFQATPYEPDQTKVSAIFSEDPVINNLMGQAYELLSPDTVKTSLLDDYKKLFKESGLKDINEELIDAETILDGTEDDIRNEIQTAGGLATESQVQAMTLARNKGLLKRYNQLFAMKQSAEQQLQTMLNLTVQDRQMAEQRVTNQINTLFQFANFRQQAQNAYRETARWALTTMGADNLYASMSGDPKQVAAYEKMMGLPSGGLATAAASAAEQRQSEQYMKNLQLQSLQLDVQKKQMEMTPTRDTLLQSSMAEDKVKEIDSLLSDVSAVGANPISRFDPLSFLTGRQANFIASVEQLRSQLSLDSLINAKARGATFGALSDSEMKLLSAAASKLGTWAVKDKEGNITGYKTTDANFKKEMDKIRNYARLDAIRSGANPESVGVLVEQGNYMMLNSDGTVTIF